MKKLTWSQGIAQDVPEKQKVSNSPFEYGTPSNFVEKRAKNSKFPITFPKMAAEVAQKKAFHKFPIR
jgi:hypothetical protein